MARAFSRVGRGLELVSSMPHRRVPLAAGVRRRRGCSRCRPGPTGAASTSSRMLIRPACRRRPARPLPRAAARCTSRSMVRPPACPDHSPCHPWSAPIQPCGGTSRTPHAADREHVVLVAQALRVDLDHDHPLAADHAHPPVRLDHQPGLLAQAEAERHGLLRAGDDQPPQPVRAHQVLVEDAGIEQAQPRLDQQAGVGIRRTPRRSAALPRCCRRRSSAATAPTAPPLTATIVAPRCQASVSASRTGVSSPRNSRPSISRRWLPPVTRKLLEPADPLDQRLPAGLAAQPVAGRAEIDGTDAVPLRAGPRSRPPPPAARPRPWRSRPPARVTSSRSSAR